MNINVMRFFLFAAPVICNLHHLSKSFWFLENLILIWRRLFFLLYFKELSAIICVQVVKDLFSSTKYKTIILLNLKNTFEVKVPYKGVYKV